MESGKARLLQQTRFAVLETHVQSNNKQGIILWVVKIIHRHTVTLG